MESGAGAGRAGFGNRGGPEVGSEIESDPVGRLPGSAVIPRGTRFRKSRLAASAMSLLQPGERNPHDE